ncbi:MAG TPA: hypothetical protein VJU84_09220 [Pyrinomonadaceae bacterium]|nr:hypothetical protein [Pyrinomonadaceae bacterium]
MGADQIAQMARSIAKVYEGVTTPDDAPALLCTFESTTPSGSQVWIQVLPGNVNMSYPFTEEPLALLRQRGVRSPPDLYLVEWVAGEYAAFGFSDVPARDHASFVDQLFVKILGCDDGSYSLAITIESVE